jgi:hypothetical protein
MRKKRFCVLGRVLLFLSPGRDEQPYQVTVVEYEVTEIIAPVLGSGYVYRLPSVSIGSNSGTRSHLRILGLDSSTVSFGDRENATAIVCLVSWRSIDVWSADKPRVVIWVYDYCVGYGFRLYLETSLAKKALLP